MKKKTYNLNFFSFDKKEIFGNYALRDVQYIYFWLFEEDISREKLKKNPRISWIFYLDFNTSLDPEI